MNILKKCIIVLLVIIFAGASCAYAAEKDGSIYAQKSIGKNEGVEIHAITYYSDGLKVKGLLFLPECKEKLPCVVFCHDGISGISDEHKKSSIRIAKKGYAVFSPSYRGEDGSEGQIEIAKGEVNDVLNAVKMLKGIKRIDSKRFALAGASHGALICVLAASKDKSIKAVVEAYGVMDIYKWWDYLKKNNKIGKDKITRQTYGDGPDDRPQSFSMRNAIPCVKNIKCPMLILQGQKDDIVPAEQAVCLKQAMDRCGVKGDIKLYPDCLHGFLVYAPYLKKDVEEAEKEQAEKAWDEMFSFLKKNL